MSNAPAMWPPVYAPAKTLLGKLQRGLGSGFLEALKTPPEALHPLLMQCITNDPRLDHQIDDRDWYYGELAQRSELPIPPIATLLAKFGEEDEAGASWMALNVLVYLTKCGNTTADAALRDYVIWGPWWEEVVFALGSFATGASWTRIARQVSSRAGEWIRNWSFEPFTTWAKTDPIAAELVAGSRARSAEWQRERSDWDQLPTGELLRGNARRPWRHVAPILAHRTGPKDREFISDALKADSPTTRGLAVLSQALNGEFSRLDVAIDLIARRPRPPYATAIGRDALLLAPAERVLPLAREWRDSRNWRKEGSALAILKLHADDSDLRWFESRLARTSTSGVRDSMVICALAEVISHRFAGHDFPLLRRRFDTFTYSYGRRFLAQALAATDPSFPTTRAFTSLWDCESGVRLVAAEHVSLDVPGARERLREMAEDSLEEDTRVAQAAAARFV